ncbi:MAG: cobalamin biosynthesis protein, partial [Actinocrinis sp.]
MRKGSSGVALAAGLAAGYVADTLLADPSKGHPVAAFGSAAHALEQRWYVDSRGRGAQFTATCVGGAAAFGYVAARGSRSRSLANLATVATATWTVVGATSLRREAAAIGDLLEAGDIEGARERLPRLCGRDPRALD